ncbi:calmodulin-binding family protein [Forsythia ovata]|uniref:Calmodulin-binding family protein n=1 Tax=Forsythia ovata TaxID=205694 RepID=A0ABD1SLB0_9LAMI
MILEGSLGFKGREMKAIAEENVHKEFGKIRNQAALKVQKTYKSFRTRRQLADCAVLVEQRWWKLLDFAELKRSSISFFAVEKPETAISRWARARTRAAKVGKGLSKDDKARKLALQHWLEAIDPRHRYGHNLQFYYVNWLQCDSKHPFFYWLDIGEGKEVNLERCPRSKLHKQCIKYLGPTERKIYEVVIEDGKFIYVQSGKLLDTREGPEDVKWIFVLCVSKTLYVGRKKKGTFQHSSFLAGGATLSAGRLVVEEGVLKAVWPHSGHYLPTEENFEEFMSFLVQHNVNLSVVQKASNNEEEVSSSGLRNSTSAPDFSQAASKASNTKEVDGEITDSSKKYSKDAENINTRISRWSRKLHSKISVLQIPRREDGGYELFKTPHQGPNYNNNLPLDSPSDGYETPEEYLSDSDFSVSKQNLFDDDEKEEEYEESIPKEKIIKRINSHKGMRSYQLGNQLSCRWTTGAGPRIGCVRDYPSELQFLVLEEVHLSPRKPFSSPRKTARSLLGIPTRSPTSLCT